MTKAIFYHAGCPVCISAEQTVADLLRGEVEKVHLGEQVGTNRRSRGGWREVGTCLGH